MQNTQHFSLPNGIVQCDLCGCMQPLSQTTTYEDGHICNVHVSAVEAQLTAEAQQRTILEQQSKQ
jgi:hypothetical protein